VDNTRGGFVGSSSAVNGMFEQPKMPTDTSRKRILGVCIVAELTPAAYFLLFALWRLGHYQVNPTSCHRSDCPVMLDYKTHAENESMYNTPPCYSMYVCGMVFDYLLKKGELQE